MNRAAKPVYYVVAARPTGMNRPDIRFAHDRFMTVQPVVVGDHTGRARSAQAVGNEAAIRSRAQRVFLVQPWCNKGGKDGFCGLNGRFCVDSIERKDGNLPHIRCVSPSQTFRSQLLYPLSYGCVVEILYTRYINRQFQARLFENLKERRDFSFCRLILGAILVQLDRRLTDRQVVYTQPLAPMTR